jgi:Mn-dependent DtxR family transcriptional regulator
MDDEALRLVLFAASQQELGKNPPYSSHDAEEADDLGYLEVGNFGRITLTEKGREKLKLLSLG